MSEVQDPLVEMSDLYFAYGPDMDPDVLRSRGGRPVAVAVARLADHRLAFFGRTPTWDSGMETVVKSPGDEVWGVLYDLGPLAWDHLDGWMDARLDGAGTYFHCPVEVVDQAGRSLWVRLYKKHRQGEPTLPSLEYLDRIVGGAGLQGLPAHYVDRLRRTVARKASFPVPVPGNPDRGAYAPLDCGTCGDAAEESEREVETC
jgi:hypothetical protein